MRARGIWALALALAGSGLVAQNQNVDGLVGSWKLLQASATGTTGVVNSAPFGARPTGVLNYTRDGRVIVLVSYSGRKPLSGADRIASPPEERAEAFATFFAYSGTYAVKGDTVTHHIEVASVPNWVNTDLVRVFSLTGQRLTLRTPPQSVGGTIQTSELVWERVP